MSDQLKTEFCYGCQQWRGKSDMTGKNGRRPKCRWCVERAQTRSSPATPHGAKPGYGRYVK